MMFKEFWEMTYGNHLNVALNLHSQGTFGNVTEFWLSNVGGLGYYRNLVGRGQDATEHPTRQRTATYENYLIQNVDSDHT